MAEQSREIDTEFDPDRVVVRDKRRLDPQTGELKEPGRGQGSSSPGAASPAAAAQPAEDGAGRPVGQPPPADPAAPGDDGGRVAELTDTLQRLQAEYSNYRKRVERDRLAVAEAAAASLLTGLLPVLDDVDRAREHGDLTGAFKVVGENLEAVVSKLGLEKYGQAGEPFDPQVHEAVLQAEPDPASTVPVCAQVFQPGYRVAGRVLRPARVAVAEPGATNGEQ